MFNTADFTPAFPAPRPILHSNGSAGVQLNHDRRAGERSYPAGRQPFSYTAIKRWAAARGKVARVERCRGELVLSIFSAAGHREVQMRGARPLPRRPLP